MFEPHVFTNSQKGAYQDRTQGTLLLMRLRPTPATAVIAAILALAACSSATPASAPVAATPASPSSSSPTPTPTPTALGEVAGVVQLRDAAVAAGYVCPSWNQTNIVEKASESGNCSDDDVLSTYTSQTDRDSIVDFMQGTDDLGTVPPGGSELDHQREGRAPGLQSRLGGMVVNSETPKADSSSDAPASDATFEGKPADFRIGVKVLKKKCFGSAGCNVTYRIDPKYLSLAEIPDTGTIEVTYAVNGLEDGEAVNTFTIQGGQASFDSEESGSVASSKTKLSARATDVSYSP